MLNLKEMKYSSEDIGSAFKTLAHEFRWEFIIEDINVCIQFFIYKISNIRKVVYNQKVLSEEHSGPNNNYFYEFIEDGHHYKIIQVENYLTQLLIDGESFDYNYTLERNKKEFDGNKFGRVDNIYNKDDDNSIQPSNEINFIKHDKPKQKFNFSIGIKNDNNFDNKYNKLNKFKFGSGENNSINKKGNKNNINSNQKINNLIDIDNFNNNDNNHNNINNFDNKYKINDNSNINVMNMQNNNNNFNKLDNNNFNNIQNDFIQNNMNQSKDINDYNYNINKIRNLTDDYLFDDDIQNEDTFDVKNKYNNNNLNMNWNEKGNSLNYNNINLLNSNNNDIMINDKGNITNTNNNIDISSYYGF